MVYVKPLKGLLVRIPVTKVVIPAKGMQVTLSGTEGKYWRRRIKDGSLIISVKPKEVVNEIDRKKGKNTFMEDKR